MRKGKPLYTLIIFVIGYWLLLVGGVYKIPDPLAPCFATNTRVPGLVYPLGYMLHCNPNITVYDNLVNHESNPNLYRR